MVPGSAIVALAIENAWAVGLINAFEAVGAEIAMHTRIPAVIVDDAIAALDAVEEDEHARTDQRNCSHGGHRRYRTATSNAVNRRQATKNVAAYEQA